MTSLMVLCMSISGTSLALEVSQSSEPGLKLNKMLASVPAPELSLCIEKENRPLNVITQRKLSNLGYVHLRSMSRSINRENQARLLCKLSSIIDYLVRSTGRTGTITNISRYYA
ncbi:uncharacterized protein BCR38DRAFT_55136 [Pseudomassariella vexata]|uniref:Uncharacterized protein n=1 Tax=Pseudomassariella vexata TaxID=1141098 RepID=A0A1Y2DLR7_9PEZI|nr:uncharacterized protein BCR38DRAFT_55136 [Pseudomassariella vexata]ORY60161.1 hypothetical protein BCR38DRAFT_55136 [Pseudomassariella vexata]